MRRIFVATTVFAMIFALALPIAPTAEAHGGVSNWSMLRAKFEGAGVPDFDPDAVASRCPDGFEWIYNTEGAGKMRTAVYRGGFEAVGQHCSRWVKGEPTDPNRYYPGRVGAGVLAFSTDEGDLIVRYRGKFKFRGDLDVPEFTSKVWLAYRVDGGKSTGVFKGARGFGLLKITDKLEAGVPSFTAKMHGPIRLATPKITLTLYADGDIGCDGTTELDQPVGRVILQGTEDGIRYHVLFRGAAPNEEYQITLNEKDEEGCVSELRRDFGFTTDAAGNGVFRGMYPMEPGVYEININVVSDDGEGEDPAHRELGTNGFFQVVVP